MMDEGVKGSGAKKPQQASDDEVPRAGWFLDIALLIDP